MRIACCSSTVAASASTSPFRPRVLPPISRTARSAAAVVNRSSTNATGSCVRRVSSVATRRHSVARGVSSPSPSRGSPITMARASSDSARRTSSAIGGRLPARRSTTPAGLAIVPLGSLSASPIRRSPQSIAIQRPRSGGIIGTSSPLAHLHEELAIVLGARHLLQQEVDRFGLGHVGEEGAQERDAVQLFRREQQFLLPRPGAIDVDRRIDPLLGDLAREHELHVPRALELLEDHLVG